MLVPGLRLPTSRTKVIVLFFLSDSAYSSQKSSLRGLRQMDSIVPAPLVTIAHSGLIMGCAERWCFSVKALPPAEMSVSNHIFPGLAQVRRSFKALGYRDRSVVKVLAVQA